MGKELLAPDDPLGGPARRTIVSCLCGASGKSLADSSYDSRRPPGETPMKTKIQLRELTDQERQDLEQLAGSRTAEARLVERARIVLAAAGGRGPSAIARDLGLSR